jgi:hypothetical protein
MMGGQQKPPGAKDPWAEVVVYTRLRLVALIIPTVTARGRHDDEGVSKPAVALGYADLALEPV